jgi:hypothetical protein
VIVIILAVVLIMALAVTARARFNPPALPPTAVFGQER